MEQEIQDVSIKRIQEVMPNVKGIDNDLIIDYNEFMVPESRHPIHKFPIRLDGLFIGLREKGNVLFNINLKEFKVGVCVDEAWKRFHGEDLSGSLASVTA